MKLMAAQELPLSTLSKNRKSFFFFKFESICFVWFLFVGLRCCVWVGWVWVHWVRFVRFGWFVPVDSFGIRLC